MVPFKAILTFALISAAVANPVEQPAAVENPLEKRDTIVQCHNVALRADQQRISVDNAKWQLGHAPIETGKSGYPHDFQNLQKLPMPQGCKNKALREYPVFMEQHKLYDYDSRPKMNPGPFRVIATKETRLFCVIISHDGQGTNPNAGNFHLCT
ncbi:hypothetical protein MGYG_03786 [Nannizzia gypsea CBS 118893]|uniref:Uncharacterized protein n=1 Tax=Arthroderma gypseum (strain ATCC MYA-4604 / CBS 118893) TaxID=535722 RepID=E4UTX6_ARTGP|nr:hypothetical protein MGYG_03786 [Nannizzia gypsea CBS 118893]EFR00782.1 hypothetical protein MGYG_03786 [Nannizzia gypsea CBS 118893]